MGNARECAHPLEGSSSSENEIVLEKMELTVSSILPGGVSFGTYAAVSTRRRASRCGSKLRRRASSETFLFGHLLGRKRRTSGYYPNFSDGRLPFVYDHRILIYSSRACHANDTKLSLEVPDASFIGPGDFVV
ncbi:hypothetical protein CRG98_023821 [Punica granatum]|uniref:Uncharacterized protein n=1 Tax=Punica granatum TaxID=22663 RepID=A0A2I0JHS3_PUNGR|nr:hypothetical protein CRG98_023821 [Punica granatum]